MSDPIFIPETDQCGYHGRRSAADGHDRDTDHRLSGNAGSGDDSDEQSGLFVMDDV